MIGGSKWLEPEPVYSVGASFTGPLSLATDCLKSQLSGFVHTRTQPRVIHKVLRVLTGVPHRASTGTASASPGPVCHSHWCVIQLPLGKHNPHSTRYRSNSTMFYDGIMSKAAITHASVSPVLKPSDITRCSPLFSYQGRCVFSAMPAGSLDGFAGDIAPDIIAYRNNFPSVPCPFRLGIHSFFSSESHIRREYYEDEFLPAARQQTKQRRHCLVTYDEKAFNLTECSRNGGK